MRRFAAISLLAMSLLGWPAAAATFKGYSCGGDCSGHKAGYIWARSKALAFAYECPSVGRRMSFYEGCLAWVRDFTDPDADDDADENSD